MPHEPSLPPAGPPSHAAGSPEYEIRLVGRLDPCRASWFDGMELHPQDDGTTVLRGRLADQAALHGVLQVLRDMGVALVSLSRIAPGSARSEDSSNDTEGPGADR